MVFDVFQGIHGLNNYHIRIKISEIWILSNWHLRENLLNVVIFIHHVKVFLDQTLKVNKLLFSFFKMNYLNMSKDICSLLSRKAP